MRSDDREVFARYLENEKTEQKLATLIKWMNCEMKSRIRAIAPVRSTTPRLGVHKFSNRKVQNSCAGYTRVLIIGWISVTRLQQCNQMTV